MSDEYDDVVENDSDVDASEEANTSVNLELSTSEIERERARLQLQADVEAFLSGGGKIQTVDVNVMADPPKRPQSNYGGQPI